MKNRNPDHDGFFAQLGQVGAEPPWSNGVILLVLAVLAVSMLIIGVVVTTLVSADNQQPTPLALLLGWMTGLIITGLFVLVRWRRTAAQFAALRVLGDTAQFRRPVLLMVLIGVATGLTTILIAALGSGREFETIAPLRGLYLPQHVDIGALLVAGIFAIVVQPVAECLVFCGVILPRLRSTLGAWPGLVLTVLLFAGFHYGVYGTQVTHPLWYGFILPLIAGTAILTIRVWMNSTRAALAAYVGFGLTAVLVMVAVA